MAAISDRDTLIAALADWSEWSDFYDADEIIDLSEADFRIHLGPNFAKETSATVSFTSGAGTLPTGFIRPINLVHATYGELRQTDIGAIRARRVWDASGIPDQYAITGSSIEVAPSYTGDLTFDYEGTLAALTASNTTNWLLTNAPQAYLSMCQSYVKAKQEDYQAAALLKANALTILDSLNMQSNLGQFARATAVIPGQTP